MGDYLTFTLAAPMASFGALAGNERRGTLDRPGHSLLVGLIGAALGLRREDPQLPALSDAARFAVLQGSRGAPLRDYHTVQTVPSRRRTLHATRREALSTGPVETALLTERDYVTDALFFAAMTLDANAPVTLADCQAALLNPHFTLYLGRKSCPLALPLAPYLRSDCADAEDALRRQEAQHPPDLWPLGDTGGRTMSGEPDLFATRGRTYRSEQRRTRPGSRSAWQYGPAGGTGDRARGRRHGDLRMSGQYYLSRAVLRKDAGLEAIAALLKPKDTNAATRSGHHLVWSLFPGDPDAGRDFLWHREAADRYLVLSARPPAKAHALFDVETKPFAPALTTGMKLSFMLRANPTVTLRDEAGARRHADVVMHAITRGRREDPKAITRDLRERALQPDGAAGAWLAAQGERAGFRPNPDHLTITGYNRVAIPRITDGGQDDRRTPVTFHTIDYQGLLKVVDPPLFLDRLVHGFGRAKAFGCGLMLLRRSAAPR